MDCFDKDNVQAEIEHELQKVIGKISGSGIYSNLSTYACTQSEEEPPDDIPLEMAILLQFQTVSEDYISTPISEAKAAIREHLRKYGGVNPEYSYDNVSKIIEKVCTYAKLDLAWNQNEPSKKGVPLFQEKWLTNIARLLPEDSRVLKILPYLITCYIITAPQNLIDPFDSPPSTFSSGWRDIFQQYLENKKEEEAGYRVTPYNQSHSIDTICRKFILPVRRRNERFFCVEEDNECQRIRGRRRGRPNKEKNSDLLSNQVLVKEQIMCWEYYRCFVALCKACGELDISNLNLTLSMALFTSIWDFGDWRSNTRHGKFILHQFSENEVESDCLMSDILGLDSEDGTSGLNLKDVVKISVWIASGGKKRNKVIDNEMNTYGEFL